MYKYRYYSFLLEGGSKAKHITNAILFMIAKNNLPFQIVENEGFQYLLKTAVPLYKLLRRKSIISLMEEKYELLSMNMKLKLLAVDAVTLTSDIWTDTLNTPLNTELFGNDCTFRIGR